MYLNEKKESFFFMKDPKINETRVLWKFLVFVALAFLPAVIFSSPHPTAYIKKIVSKPITTYWKCQHCGYRNNCHRDVCENCDEPKVRYWYKNGRN